MRINVQRGTHAGWKQMQERKGEWECRCEVVDVVKPDGNHEMRLKLQKGFMVRCPDCGAYRDGHPDDR